MWAKSPAAKALIAIAFLVGFYVVATAIALFLLYLPVLEYRAFHRVSGQLSIFSLATGLVILWSLIPRYERFKAPGKLISPSEHPRLFALIQEVGQAMGIEPPTEVYLVGDVNAFVSHRGGFLGQGGRRYMGIGVPLLAFLNVSQLKGLLAHEYGHFAGGETRLVGVTYATRSSMIRTLQNLRRTGHELVQMPFQWIFTRYLLITQSISREQELVADGWAVRLAGSEAHISTLRLIHLNASAYELYLKHELVPLSHIDVAPDNYLEGFRQFLHSSYWAKTSQQVYEALRRQQPDPYDSHPATEDRIIFARSLAAPEIAMDTTPAWSLLENPELVERSFSDALRPAGAKVVDWNSIGRAWQKHWNLNADRVQARIPTLTLGGLEDQLATPAKRRALAEQIAPVLLGDQTPEHVAKIKGILELYLESWLGSLLIATGCGLSALPGEPLQLLRGDEVLNLRDHLVPVIAGKSPSAELIAWLKSLGLEESARWQVDELNRDKVLAPSCKLTLKEARNYIEVVAPLSQLHFPQCCAMCLAPLQETTVIRFRLGGLFKQHRYLNMPVPTCMTHFNQASKVWDLRELNEKTSMATIRFASKEYARLMQASNA